MESTLEPDIIKLVKKIKTPSGFRSDPEARRYFVALKPDTRAQGMPVKPGRKEDENGKY